MRYPYIIKILLCVCHTTLLLAQNNNMAPASENERLNGRVQQVISTRYEAAIRGGEIVPIAKLESVEEDYILSFDTKGNKVQEQYYDPDGKVGAVYSYLYNEANKLLQINYQNRLAQDVNCETAYEYNEQNQLLSQISTCGNTTLNTSTYYQYNFEGLLIKTAQYDGRQKLDRESVCEYNNQQQIVKTSYLFPQNPTANYYLTCRYDNKRLAEKTEYYANGALHTIETYDRAERLISVVQYQEDGKVLDKLIHQYDADGAIIQTTVFDANGKMQRFVSYEYDKKKRVVKTNLNYPADKKKYCISYTYASNGKLSSETNEDITNNRTTMYKYLYDRQNNWVKKITFEDKKPKDIVVRTIIYY
ncbi:MAG TPA: hypothetical protein PKH93_07315 [Chitinophagales bacterium]|nr:hypothetical protein [Chitinophagales bacterium]